MREALGIVGPTCLLTLAGLGVLFGAGMIRPTLRAAAPALGLAYLAGVSAVMLLGLAVISLGAGFNVALFTLSCLLFAAGGLLIAARRSNWAPQPNGGVRPALGPLGWMLRPSLAVLGVLVAGYLVVLLLTALVQPMDTWDAWSLWTRKARILADYDGIPTQFFVDPANAFRHQYPLLLPLFESVHIRAMGEVDEGALHAVFWLLMISFLGALAFLTWRVRSSDAWLAALLLGALVPGVYWQLPTAYADFPMAFLLGIGVLLLGLWLRSGERSELVVAVLLLGAAANVKNEALPMVAIALLVAAALLASSREWARLRQIAAAAAALVLAVLPWRLWVAIHDVPSDIPIAKGLTPGFLIERLDRVWPSFKALSWNLFKQGGWIVPVACLTMILAARTRPDRRLGLFYLLTAAGVFISVLWAFMVRPAGLQWQLDNGANRVVVGAIFVLLVGVAHLWSASGDRLARQLAPREPERESGSA
jgi:hypothetical protein